jgi:RHS repeat-associated protein
MYGGSGLRMSKTTGVTTTTFSWVESGQQPLLLQEQTGGGATSYIYGADGAPLEQIAPSGIVNFYNHDQLGSTRALTSAAGGVAATYSYNPYGTVVSCTGTTVTVNGSNLCTGTPVISNAILFSGQYRDNESGFYYLRARYYDPATAQFLARDPAVAMTMSAYSYVDGNPLNRTDPSGLFTGCDALGNPTPDNGLPGPSVTSCPKPPTREGGFGGVVLDPVRPYYACVGYSLCVDLSTVNFMPDGSIAGRGQALEKSCDFGRVTATFDTADAQIFEAEYDQWLAIQANRAQASAAAEAQIQATYAKWKRLSAMADLIESSITVFHVAAG